MLLSVEQEGALVENGILGFTARAIEHELGEFLAAQIGCTGEDGLHACRCPNLDDIVRGR